MRGLISWTARIAGSAVLAVGGLVAALALLPSSAHASITCDTSWAAATSGDWNTASNWTSGVPTASTNACITLTTASYTVSITGATAQAKTVTLGAASGATRQTLALVATGCGANSTLTIAATGSTVKKTGILQETSTTCGGNTDVLTVSSGTLTSTGVLDVEPGAGGDRQLSGAFVNNGTMTVNANAHFLSPSSLTNQGAINIADGLTLSTDASSGSPNTTVANGAGGAINASGVAQSGVFYMNGGNSFTEGAGTTNVANTFVDGSALTYTGSGASQIMARDNGTLTGAPSAGQTLVLQALGCGGSASETLTASATNAGTIQLNSAVCGGNTAQLTVAPGATLTSTGVLDIEPGTGGTRQLSGAFVSSGTVTVNAPAHLLAQSSFTNNGATNIADGVQWTIDSPGAGQTASNFTNGSSGSINSVGGSQTGVLYENGSNTFTEAGTTNSANTFVDGSALTYSGGGASQIIARGAGTVTGAPASGQSLTLQAVGCGENSTQSLTGSATNAGTIQLNATTCGGNTVQLAVTSGATLTSTGVLDIEPGAGGDRQLSGAFINNGTMTVNTNAHLLSPSSLTNQGAINIADGLTLSTDASSGSPNTTVGNGTGGAINASGVAQSGIFFMHSGNSFTEGAGTTNVANTFVDGSALTYTGSGASQIIARGTGTVTGAPATGQTLTLQAVGCGETTTQKLTGSATNAGTIQLSSVTCSGNPVTLSVPSGATLTNNGTLSVQAGTGGTRTITGNITNGSTGTIAIAAKTSYRPTSLFTNDGTVLATAGFTIANSKTGVVDNAAGSMKGPIGVSKGIFEQGNGLIKGSLTVNNGTADFIGTGTGTIVAKGTDVLEGTLVAKQVYTIESLGCGPSATTTTSGAVVNGGSIVFTSKVCGGNPDTLTIPTGSSLTSSGSITVLAGTGGTRTITAPGGLTNTGTVNVDAATSFSGSWDNKGILNVADSVSLSAPTAPPATTFTNDTGGSVVTTGDGATGNLYLNGGNTFVEGAGTTSGGPVFVDNSTLTYTGSGASWIVARGAGTLTSNIPSSVQTLWIQAVGCGESANETATSSFTNHGMIVLTSTTCGGNPSALTLPSGGTLTNDGTLQSVNGSGGSRTLNGNLNNAGTVGPSDPSSTLQVNGNYTNTSTGTLAVTVPTSNAALSISGTATINGGTLHAVPQSGSSFTPGQTFPALSAGTVTGTFTTVSGAAGQTWTALYNSTTVSLQYVGP